MALQTLVENAVKHGVEPNVDGSDIAISARRHDGVVTITVANTGALRAPVGLDPRRTGQCAPAPDAGAGTGRQLDLDAQAGGVHAVLQLPQQP